MLVGAFSLQLFTYRSGRPHDAVNMALRLLRGNCGPSVAIASHFASKHTAPSPEQRTHPRTQNGYFCESKETCEAGTHQSLYLNLSFLALISASVCARSSSETPSRGFSTDMALSSASSPVRRNGLYVFSSISVDGHCAMRRFSQDADPEGDPPLHAKKEFISLSLLKIVTVPYLTPGSLFPGSPLRGWSGHLCRTFPVTLTRGSPTKFIPVGKRNSSNDKILTSVHQDLRAFSQSLQVLHKKYVTHLLLWRLSF